VARGKAGRKLGLGLPMLLVAPVRGVNTLLIFPSDLAAPAGLFAFGTELGRAPRQTMPLVQLQLGLSQKLRQLGHVPRYIPCLVARE
jgi:hypothetical protein